MGGRGVSSQDVAVAAIIRTKEPRGGVRRVQVADGGVREEAGVQELVVQDVHLRNREDGSALAAVCPG